MHQKLSLYDQVEEFRAALVERATQGSWPKGLASFRDIRQQLVSLPDVNVRLPSFLRSCRNEADFWGFIKKYGTYQERRDFLRDEFSPLLQFLEQGANHPLNEQTLPPDAWDDVHAHWKKARDRKDNDPEGAITTARTLLESVCKHILQSLGESYDDKADLPPLYRQTARALNLAPEQHQEEMFKQILGGCFTVVTTVGALRNKVGDAHGKAQGAVKPAPRHAELAVNLAGSMALFLVQTWQKMRDERAQAVNSAVDWDAEPGLKFR